MKIIPKFRALGIFLCLSLLCSCATEKSIHTQLPSDVVMNSNAGCGGQLFVTLRLESGERVLFGVDTGAFCTVFDKSLESKLGNRVHDWNLVSWGVKEDSGVYAAPRLYLGNTQLMMTGTNILIFDCKKRSPELQGILGMDVLEHYCIQLDFAAGKLRFLDDEHADKRSWGKPFPLTNIGDGCFSIGENLAGVKGAGSLIDTGCNYDGWLTSQLFQQWTNQAILPTGDEARYPNAVLAGEHYPDFLHLHRLDGELTSSGDLHMKANGIGLHFLSRHLVTFDFPKQTMYLKRTSIGPLFPEGSTAALALLKDLKKKGQVPGWAKNDNQAYSLEAFSYPDPQSLILSLVKDGNSSIYKYTVTQISEASPWKLQKAWRTDQAGSTVEEYSLP
jgi:hypothetical protein